MSILISLWESILGWISPGRGEQRKMGRSPGKQRSRQEGDPVDVEIGMPSQANLTPADPHILEKQREVDRRNRILADQKKREEEARESGSFVKNQPAHYFHKSSGQWFESHVVGVHHDDDPDNPYYTIKYRSADGEQIEKQTTGDRLNSVEWDEERSWEILSARLNR